MQLHVSGKTGSVIVQHKVVEIGRNMGSKRCPPGLENLPRILIGINADGQILAILRVDC